MLLLNPKHHDRTYPDDRSRQIMHKTIAWFEDRGLRRTKQDDYDRTWYADFLEFVRRERLFATLWIRSNFGWRPGWRRARPTTGRGPGNHANLG